MLSQSAAQLDLSSNNLKGPIQAHLISNAYILKRN